MAARALPSLRRGLPPMPIVRSMTETLAGSGSVLDDDAEASPSPLSPLLADAAPVRLAGKRRLIWLVSRDVQMLSAGAIPIPLEGFFRRE
jgi:hypothetical protein